MMVKAFGLMPLRYEGCANTHFGTASFIADMLNLCLPFASSLAVTDREIVAPLRLGCGMAYCLFNHNPRGLLRSVRSHHPQIVMQRYYYILK